MKTRRRPFPRPAIHADFFCVKFRLPTALPLRLLAAYLQHTFKHTLVCPNKAMIWLIVSRFRSTSAPSEILSSSAEAQSFQETDRATPRSSG